MRFPVRSESGEDLGSESYIIIKMDSMHNTKFLLNFPIFLSSSRQHVNGNFVEHRKYQVVTSKSKHTIMAFKLFFTQACTMSCVALRGIQTCDPRGASKMDYPLSHRGASILKLPRQEQLSWAATLLPFQLGKQGFCNCRISRISSDILICLLQPLAHLWDLCSSYTVYFSPRRGRERGSVRLRVQSHRGHHYGIQDFSYISLHH